MPLCHAETGQSLKMITAAASWNFEGFTFPLQAASTFHPRWDLVEADDWAKRQHLLQRFVQAGRRVICRLRASRRLARIMALAQEGMRDPTQVCEPPSLSGAQWLGADDRMKACGFCVCGFGTRVDVSDPTHLGDCQQQRFMAEGCSTSTVGNLCL